VPGRADAVSGAVGPEEWGVNPARVLFCLHSYWAIPNFRSLSGTNDERLAGARRIRDRIQAEVLTFLAQLGRDADRV